jgi:Fur family transcriptional regulator, ferric uptake regulator
MSTSQQLNTAGLRNTKARRVVLDVLNRADQPLSHPEIAAEPGVRGLDRVTLYRTLATLSRVGLLHRVQDVNGVWRFRANQVQPGVCAGNHVHFLCLECNQMSCLSDQALPWVEEPAGAEVLGKQLVVYGRCSTCNSQGDNG